MASVYPFTPQLIEPSLPADAAKVSAVVTAIKLMLSGLNEAEQAAVKREVWPDAALPAPTPSAGPVLGTVVRLLPKQKEWTVDQLKREVAAQGVEATAKELYNALGYLTRKKRITRVGYGQYVIDGEGLLVTADDLGIPPNRDECGDY